MVRGWGSVPARLKNILFVFVSRSTSYMIGGFMLVVQQPEHVSTHLHQVPSLGTLLLPPFMSS